jgi:hypothetical protein
MSRMFPDRKLLQDVIAALSVGVESGVYDSVYVDARSGLPNMASFTRASADSELSEELHARNDMPADPNKRTYHEHLLRRRLGRIEHHDVALRRVDPKTGAAAVRIDLTKLGAAGTIVRVRVELTQVPTGRASIVVDGERLAVEASELLHSAVYRLAGFEAEALFARLTDLAGITVERVERGEIGPFVWCLPGGAPQPIELMKPFGALVERWSLPPSEDLELLVGFHTDMAARDVKEERSNDPLSPLMRQTIEPSERARYVRMRETLPFRVYKDRKWVATGGYTGLAKAIADGAGLKNIVYKLR